MGLSDLFSRIKNTFTSAPRTLDELSELSAEALAALYKKAKTPRVEDLDGPLLGRLLAVPAAEAIPGLPGLIKRFSRSRVFPWQGKNFKTVARGRGAGVNRVLGNRAEWFRFETFAGKSNSGDFEVVHLNYDNPGNPGLVRRIKDEVREVSPGLWLGLAHIKTEKSLYLALYFALAKPPKS